MKREEVALNKNAVVESTFKMIKQNLYTRTVLNVNRQIQMEGNWINYIGLHAIRFMNTYTNRVYEIPVPNEICLDLLDNGLPFFVSS